MTNWTHGIICTWTDNYDLRSFFVIGKLQNAGLKSTLKTNRYGRCVLMACKRSMVRSKLEKDKLIFTYDDAVDGLVPTRPQTSLINQP